MRRRGHILPAWVLAIVLVPLAAALAAGRFTAGAWATWERSSAERAARAAGLPLTAAAFEAKYPKPAEADDLADELVLSAGFLETKAPAWQAYGDFDDETARLRQDGELPPPEALEVYRKAVASQQGVLNVLDGFDQRLDPLTGRPAGRWPFVPADDSARIIQRRLPWLNPQRHLATLLRLEAVTQVADGDAAGALRTIRLNLGQARATADSDYLTAVLTSLGINASANDALDVFVANLRPDQIGDGPRQASRGDLRAMIALLLDDGPIRAALARGLAGDALMGLDTIDHTVAADELIGGVKLPAGTGPFAPFQRRLAVESLAWLLRPLIDREAAAYLGVMTQAAAAIDSADAPEWVERAPGDLEANRIVARKTPLPLAMILLPATERAGVGHFRVIASRHRAAAALAVRLYQADHDGDLPPTLDALVPGYLPAVPRDTTAADSPVRYDSARRRLWTAGTDGDDDGGTSEADLLREDPRQSYRDLRGRFDEVRVLR